MSRFKNPFDKNTLPYADYEKLIAEADDKLPTADIEGKGGKYLRVKEDESGTEWASGGGGGSSDYEELLHKPQIAGVTLIGNKSLTDLGIASSTELTSKLDKNLGTSEAGKMLKVADTGDVTTDNYNEFTTTEKDKLSNIQPRAEKNVQSNWAETVSTASDYILNKPTSFTPSTHASTHGKDAADAIAIDGSQVTSGMIDASHVPAGTFQKLVIVADETARKALTSTDVNNGDTVKQNDTGIMYFVKDNTKLSIDDGWLVYTAVTPWDSITSKPTLPKGVTIDLSTDGWNEQIKQVVNVTGVTSDCYCIVEPTPSSYDSYYNNNVKCVEQAEGTLTFQADIAPSVVLHVAVVMVYN